MLRTVYELRWKNSVFSIIDKNFDIMLGVLVSFIFATSFWLGFIFARNIRSWVIHILILENYNKRNYITNTGKTYKFRSLFFRCTPDWHSDKRKTSYVLWILAFGFCIPTLVIILSSITTCFKIRQVTYKFLVQALYILINPYLKYFTFNFSFSFDKV